MLHFLLPSRIDCSCQDRRRKFLQNGRSPPYAHGLPLHNKHLRGDDLQVQYRRPLKISAYNTSDILLDNPRAKSLSSPALDLLHTLSC
jgi:hypothetical protein